MIVPGSGKTEVRDEIDLAPCDRTANTGNSPTAKLLERETNARTSWIFVTDREIG